MYINFKVYPLKKIKICYILFVNNYNFTPVKAYHINVHIMPIAIKYSTSFNHERGGTVHFAKILRIIPFQIEI